MRIAIALSGGIDSSAAAWLLQQQGYDVTGVTMHHFSNREMQFDTSEGIEAVIKQAASVCRFLKIPHQVIDVSEYFSNSIVNNFIDEYRQGRTPNPCTLCNRVIKWGVFLEEITKLGFDKMATGHYIRLKKEGDFVHLYRSVDQGKDQSYMLWQLNQKQLARTMFPLASLTKPEAKDIIKKQGIPVKTDQESQEICFIKGHYEEFLRPRIKLEPGDILLTDGSTIGRHYGLPLYTIGQRKHLHTNLNVPLYVKELDTVNNHLIVTTDNSELSVLQFSVDQVNWISTQPVSSEDLSVQIRYNSAPVRVNKFTCFGNYFQVELFEPVRAVTPGQSAVFYQGDELLGGGIIRNMSLW